MRIRSIKPEFWNDALAGEWNATLALFFVGIWQVADDSGRLRLDPRLIRAELDPFDAKFGGTKGVQSLLEELIRLRRVLPYNANGQRLGLVARFTAHQRIDKPTKSRLPDPPGVLREDSARIPGALQRKESVDQGAWSRDQGAGSEELAAAPLASAMALQEPVPRLLPAGAPEAGTPIECLAQPADGPPNWPRAVAFRRALTDRMARTALYPVGKRELETWKSLEASLEVVPLEEALELCRERIVAAVARKGRQPGSLAYFAQALADETSRRRLAPPAAPDPDPGCPAWTAARERARKQLRPDLYELWFRDLVGTVRDGALVLVAPDRFQADFCRDNYTPFLTDMAGMPVVFEAPPAAAAGGER
jgi:hypothetical protein